MPPLFHLMCDCEMAPTQGALQRCPLGACTKIAHFGLWLLHTVQL